VRSRLCCGTKRAPLAADLCGDIPAEQESKTKAERELGAGEADPHHVVRVLTERLLAQPTGHPRSHAAATGRAKEDSARELRGITTTMQQVSSTYEQRDRGVEHDQNGKPNGASGVGTGSWVQQAWPHTVFVDFEDRDGEWFEAEIRVSSVTQAEATEKVRDLLEQLDTQVEPPSGYRPVSTPAEVFSAA
jgi:hypothetical protein